MGKSSPPKPPDPKETSQASTSTNVGTAVANAFMGNVNQITPYGTLNYDQTGMHQWNDPYTGRTYDIPTFTATQTLSPSQQQLLDTNQATQGNLANLAKNQSSFLLDYLSKGVDTSGLPSLVSNPGLQTGVGGGYNTAFSQDIGGGYDPSFSRGIGGSYTDQIGPGYATTYAGADDFSADRQRYEDALWQRGSDDRAQMEEGLRSRLLNSGIREGSTAWNAEMERLGRQNSDARLATMLAAGDEQSRMVGMARDAAMFGNQAITNRFQLENQAALTGAQFGREGQLAQNQAALAQAMFGREGQLAQNQAALAQAQFGNNARLTNAQFQNAARGQGMQELYAGRNHPINEIIGLMSGTQVQQPNFVNASMPTIPTTDVAGLINENYNQRLNIWQQQQAQTQGLLGGLFGLGGRLLSLSDRRTKEDIEKVGKTSDGQNVYSFAYKADPSHRKHVGLMAQEVEKKKPGAVLNVGGVKMVDYAKALPMGSLLRAA